MVINHKMQAQATQLIKRPLIRVLSDLHLEFFPTEDAVRKRFAPMLNNPTTDYLILAGDICTPSSTGKLKAFLDLVHHDSTTKTFYVLGNHEYYGDVNKVKDVIQGYRNCYLLDNSGYKDDQLSVFGSTLWSNISYEAYRAMTDSQYMAFNRYNIFHEKSVKAIAALKEPVDIMITHHLPSLKFIHPKFQGSPVNSAFASDCEYLFPKAKSLWVFGHSHCHFDEFVGETRFVSNPHGYPREACSKKDYLIEFTK